MTPYWRVRYQGGGELSQYDAAGAEVPYRAIEWSRAEALILESDAATTELALRAPPTGVTLSLRSRHFASMNGASTMCFVLLGAGPAGPMEDTVFAVYWFPDGHVFASELFDDPAARDYAAQMTACLPSS